MSRHWPIPSPSAIGAAGDWCSARSRYQRTTRATMLEVLRADYVRTARAKGLSRRSVIWGMRCAMRASPSSRCSASSGQLLGGVVITETVFSWPGIGKLTVDAIFARDYPVVQGAVLLTALFVVISLATDLIDTVLDPRVRHEH